MLDNKLLAQPPILNEVVTTFFQTSPIYLNYHRDTGPKKRLHTQPGVEIDITHEGNAYFVVDGKIYRQQPGSLMIIPGKLAHQLYVETGSSYRRTVLCLDQSDMGNRADKGLFSLIQLDWIPSEHCIHCSLSPEVYIQLKRICEAMRKELDTRQSGWESMVFSHVLELSVFIQRSLEEHKHREKQASFDLVEFCIGYIQDHMYEDLSLINMAQMLSVSPEHLTRQFKKVKGISYYQYVLTQRVQEVRFKI